MENTGKHRLLQALAILSAVFLFAISALPAESSGAGRTGTASAQTGGGRSSATPTTAVTSPQGAGGECQADGKEEAKKEKVRVYTNADLAKLDPIPSQRVPIAEASASAEEWDSINAFIERERAYEQQQRDREMAREVMNREEKARQQQVENPTYSLPYAAYSNYPGVCPSYGCGGRRGLPQPTNIFAPLAQRGIRSAAGLYRESVYNSAARRANMP